MSTNGNAMFERIMTIQLPEKQSFFLWGLVKQVSQVILSHIISLTIKRQSNIIAIVRRSIWSNKYFSKSENQLDLEKCSKEIINSLIYQLTLAA